MPDSVEFKEVNLPIDRHSPSEHTVISLRTGEKTLVRFNPALQESIDRTARLNEKITTEARRLERPIRVVVDDPATGMEGEYLTVYPISEEFCRGKTPVIRRLAEFESST